MYGALLTELESGATVVTANNRLARTLRHAYDQQAIVNGLQAWATPQILSWSQWMRRLWDESRLGGGVASDLRLLEDSATILLWQDAIRSADPNAVVLPLTQLARGARSAWAQLHDWQVLDAEEWTDAGLSPDQRAFLQWSGTFRSFCAERSVISSEQLCGLLTEDVAAGLFAAHGKLLFAGFDDWVPARRQLREALEVQGGEILMVAGPTDHHDVRATMLPSSEDELFAAALWARQKLEEEPEAAIGVVFPDLASRAEEIRRVFGDVFEPGWRVSGWPTDLPLNISYGRALADTPLVHTALLLFRMAAGRAVFDDMSLLLRTPWWRGGESECGPRGRLEIALRDRVRIEFRLQECLPTAEKIAPQFGSNLAVLIERSQQVSALGLRPAADWAHWLTDLLKATGWPGDGALDSESWQTMQAWNKLLAAFAVAGEQREPISHQDAVSILSQLAHDQLYQAEGPPHGVQVMGVLEAAGHQFDQLWVCGMARELWPAAAKPNPFIPLSLQRRMGMPDCDAGQTFAYTERLTRRLLGSAPSVVVSWPGQLDGEELAISPLIGVVNRQETTVADSTWNRQMLNHGEPEWLTDDKVPPVVIDGCSRGGTSLLNLQAVSPLNAFIEKRLGATEIRRPPVGIDALRRGNITHKALELFYQSVNNRTQLAAIAAELRSELLSTAIKSACRNLPGLYDPFMQQLVARELRHQLERIEAFIELDIQRPDFTVGSLEEPREVSIGPLTIRVKLDRLDTLESGGRFIIDYKTGNINRQDWNPDKPRDLQLPLYVSTVAHDADAVAFAQVSVRGIGFDGVGIPDTGIAGIRSPGTRNRIQVKYQHPQTDEVIETWDALREEWFHLLERLAAEFAAGDFRLDPLNPDSARGQFAVLSRVYDAQTADWWAESNA